MSRFTTAILALVAIAFTSCDTTQKATTPEVPQLPLDQRLTSETVTRAAIESHIAYLASDEMAGRDTPSDELNIAARYLSTNLMRYGVKPVPGNDGYFQRVPMNQTVPATEGKITIGDEVLEINKDFVMLRGDNMDMTADMVFVNRGAEEDYADIEVSGKIAVALCGFEGQESPQQWFFAARDKRAIAEEKGAAALVEVYNNTQLPFNFLIQFLSQPRTSLDDGSGTTFPHLWMSTSNETAVKAVQESTPSGGIMLAGYESNEILTYNVVGMIEGTDPALKDEYIIYSAHYDHVGIGRPVEGDSIYNGARDNAVGSTTVLLAAENIAKYPTRRSALLIFFTGEEKGLLGSSYYADNPLIPLDKVMYCFNSDNAGYNDTSRASIIGLTRTTAQPIIEKACTTFGLDAMEDAAPEQNLFDRSDNVNFAAKGVPAPTYSLGYTGFDDAINKYYHQPADDPQSLDYNYLEKFFKSYIYSARMIANHDTKLFWVEGDKYYDVGKELYGMD